MGTGRCSLDAVRGQVERKKVDEKQFVNEKVHAAYPRQREESSCSDFSRDQDQKENHQTSAGRKTVTERSGKRNRLRTVRGKKTERGKFRTFSPSRWAETTKHAQTMWPFNSTEARRRENKALASERVCAVSSVA